MGNVQNIRNRSDITDQHIAALIKECIEKVKSLNFSIPENLRFLECNAARRAGLACYTDTTIVLSRFIYKENDDAIRKIIYHEIGHIVAGPGVHHGPKWKNIVNKIGNATGLVITRCYKDSDMPVHAEERKSAYKFIFRCTGCGCEIHYNRRTEFVNTYNQTMSNGKPRWTCRRCQGVFEMIKN